MIIIKTHVHPSYPRDNDFVYVNRQYTFNHVARCWSSHPETIEEAWFTINPECDLRHQPSVGKVSR